MPHIEAPRLTKTQANGSYAQLAGGNVLTGDQTVHDGALVLDWSDVDAAHAPSFSMKGFNGYWYAGGLDTANSPTSRDYVPLAKRGLYSINDAVTTSGSPTLTSAAEGNFTTVFNVGQTLTGAGIPNGTTVLSVESATSLTMSANATVSATAVRVTFNSALTNDVIYVAHNGGGPATFGIGVTPPDKTAILQVVVGNSANLAMDGLRLVQGSASATGKYLRCTDSSNADHFWIDKNANISGVNAATGAALGFLADATNGRPFGMMDHAGANVYGWEYNGTSIRFRCLSNSTNLLQFDLSGTTYVYNDFHILNKITHQGAAVGFFSTTPIAKRATTADATDLASVITLANALKADLQAYGLKT